MGIKTLLTQRFAGYGLSAPRVLAGQPPRQVDWLTLCGAGRRAHIQATAWRQRHGLSRRKCNRTGLPGLSQRDGRGAPRRHGQRAPAPGNTGLPVGTAACRPHTARLPLGQRGEQLERTGHVYARGTASSERRWLDSCSGCHSGGLTPWPQNKAAVSGVSASFPEPLTLGGWQARGLRSETWAAAPATRPRAPGATAERRAG